MIPVVRDWLAKAEEDWRVASREARVRLDAAYGAVCFHAQQCAEKYLKAYLLAQAIPFPKTHDLLTLRALGGRPLGILDRNQVAKLSTAAVEYRYPGRNPTRADANRSLAAARRIRSAIRRLLGS